MSTGADPHINLSKASVLTIDPSQHSLDLLGQVLRGFGVPAIARCSTLDEAEKLLNTKTVDLILIDPSIGDGGGYSFVAALRRGSTTNCHVPVILTPGHVKKADVSRARNTGANFVVTKPVSPKVLLQRIQWVARDKRPFVEIGEYVGPDRRFKFEGPPDGSDGRRESDLKTPLGDANEPNLSQAEVDQFIVPQRVMI